MALHYCNTHYDSHEGHMPPFMLVFSVSRCCSVADVSIGLMLQGLADSVS